MNNATGVKIIKILQDYYGNPAPALNYKNNYQLAIAVALSAQTTDDQVNRVTPVLFKKYPSFKQLAKAGTLDVEFIIHSTGFYKVKAKNIISMAKQITTKHNGELPDKIDELLQLSGIGRKTANVILAQGFDKPAFAVDTHVKRVANRLGFIDSDDTKKVEDAMCKVIKAEELGRMHLVFISHGRQICHARKPECPICPVMAYCDYSDKTC